MSATDFLRAAWLIAGLILPGAGWARAWRWPLPWVGAGLLSALAIFGGVLLFDAAGVKVSALSLSSLLLVVGLPGWWLAWRRASPSDTSSFDWRLGWIALPVLPLLAVAIWRAVAQPLSGPDTVFRWNALAELLVESGGLHGYPCVSVADFSNYFWADGIAPLVSSLYGWCYLAAGSTLPAWTAPVVLAQVAGILAVAWGLATEWGGARAGWFAVAAVGATMLLQFAVNLGQETGLTALGCGAMVLYLVRWERARDWRLLVPAGIAAAVVACAREYGAVAALVAAGWLFAVSRSGRAVLAFLVVGLALAVCWHLRVAWITGNPLFAHDVAGWPTNPVFNAWMQRYRVLYAAHWGESATWLQFGRLLAISSLPALAGFAFGLRGLRPVANRALVLTLALAFVAVWLWSISSTAGGLFYSLRVLSPVALLGCAGAGLFVARWTAAPRATGFAVALLTIVAEDASLRALTLPSNPYSLPMSAWAGAGDAIQRDFERDDAPFLRQAVALVDGRVLSDSAGLRPFFHAAGKSYSPLWSPDVAWLFTGQPVPDAARRLRALGYSHLLIKRSDISVDFLRASGALASLDGHLQPALANGTFVLMRLEPDSSLARP